MMIDKNKQFLESDKKQGTDEEQVSIVMRDGASSANRTAGAAKVTLLARPGGQGGDAICSVARGWPGLIASPSARSCCQCTSLARPRMARRRSAGERKNLLAALPR